MTASTTGDLLNSVGCLHKYLFKNHWDGRALRGPDSGIRFNARIGRFIKSYLSLINWSDDYTYMQAQGYWILDNWLMADLLDNEHYGELAVACSNFLLSVQKPKGYWAYPNPEWKDRVATVEGCFAALGLLESYDRTQHEPFLDGAKKWYRYLMKEVGFQENNGLLAINYFAHTANRGGGVPNNTTLVLWNLARFAEVTNDTQYLETCGRMVGWLAEVQLDSGELPYALGRSAAYDRPHFLCYQYNAFEFLDLAEYFRITGDEAIWPLIERLAAYLASGLTESGATRYDCHQDRPEVIYYSAAVAHALSQATMLGIGDFSLLADRAYQWLLSHQRANGEFEFYSRANYGFLTDRRSYPRNLAMILNHLLREIQIQKSRLKADVSYA